MIQITRPDLLCYEYLAAAIGQTPINSFVEHLDLPFVNQGMVLDYPLPLPPLELQLQFEQFLSQQQEMMSNRAAVLNETSKLFASLVQRAFRGEL